MATGTRLMQEISDQFLNCKICFENFRDPKTLSCLHTFCCACLQEQYNSEASGRSSRYAIYSRSVTCPLCRQKTDLPTGGVRRLPDNFLVSNLTEVLAKRSVSMVPPCEICHSVRNKNVDACSKCLDCCKLLCKGCVEQHVSTKVTKRHSLIDLEGEKNIECKIHPDEVVRFYCEPCDTCICVVCTFQEHKDHEVCSFTDGFAKHRLHLESLVTRCKEKLEGMNTRLQCISKHETCVRDVKEKIRDLAISLIAQVRSTERELMKRLEEEFGSQTREFLESKPIIQEAADELQSACNLTDIMLKDKGIDLLLLKKEMETKMNHLLDMSLPEIPENLNHDIRFVPGETVLGRLSFGGKDCIDDDDDDDLKSKDRLITYNDINGHTTGTFEARNRKNKSNAPDVLSNCTQTDSCRTCEMSTSMLADMTIGFSHSDSQTDLTKAAIDELYVTARKAAMEAQKDAKATSNGGSAFSLHEKKSEVTPPPDLLPKSSLTYTPGRWIRSRKIQTDISSMDFMASRQMSDREYVHALLLSEQLHKPKTDPCLDNVIVARDPSFRRTSDAETMTSQDVRSSQVLSAALRQPQPLPAAKNRRNMSVLAVCDSCNVETQTPVRNFTDAITCTDKESQMEKWTSTPSIALIDRETSTPHVTYEQKTTWTELVSTSDRATSTITTQLKHRSTGTVPVKTGDVSFQATPYTQTISTNTPSAETHDAELQATVELTDQGTIPDIAIEEAYTKLRNMPDESSVDSQPAPAPPPRAAPVQRRDQACDAFKPPTLCKATETLKVKKVSSATETFNPKFVDKDASTVTVTTTDQWTETTSPQLVSTGVTPPRPATLEVGVATVFIQTNDQASCTDVTTYRSSHTETTLSVCDNETITDTPGQADAQTCVHIPTENAETETDLPDCHDQASNTDILDSPSPEVVRRHAPQPETSDINVQTDFSFVHCSVCHHLEGDAARVLNQGNANAGGETLSSAGQEVKGSNSSTSTPLVTNEVGTMAISCVTCQHNLHEAAIQTSSPQQADKASATSFDFEHEDFLVRALSREYQDAATSTESLPYIGLLSEIDVDELIVVPEAAFELVSDSDSDFGHCDMVDSETCTDFLQLVEAGTQTLTLPGLSPDEAGPANDPTSIGGPLQEWPKEPMADSSSSSQSGKGIGEIIRSMVHSEGEGSMLCHERCVKENSGSGTKQTHTPISVEASSKHFVSIGVNTAPKVTFEKETCTPIRHLFSKGTMTFYVSKMDKATSTLTSIKMSGDAKQGGRVMVKTKSEDKITMTPKAEKRDIGVETETTVVNGRIEKCISKLRNISERLNSPTGKKVMDGQSFFGNGFASSPKSKPETDDPNNLQVSIEKSGTSSDEATKIEEERLKNLNNLLQQAAKPVIKPKDMVPLRKPQPITTLKGRKPVSVKGAECTAVTSTTLTVTDSTSSTYGSKSLPRQFSIDRPRPMKMGSQPLVPSRLPLLRYNSAPGRIATVPSHTLLMKSQNAAAAAAQHVVNRPTSPSKIPISKKLSPPDKLVSAPMSPPVERKLPEIPAARPQLRHPLPSITETRTPSSCSDTSMTSYLSSSSAVESMSASGPISPDLIETKRHSTDSSSILDKSKQALSSTSTGMSTSLTEEPKSKTTSSRPISAATSSSLATLNSDSFSDSVFKKSSTETLHSAASSDTLEEKTSPVSTTAKKSGLGFMQRLLSKRKKGVEQKKGKPAIVTTGPSPAEAATALASATPVPQAPAPESQAHGAQLQLPPHHYPPQPQPQPKSPAMARKSRPFVYVRQRIFSIQQDNVEETTGDKQITPPTETEKKSKEHSPQHQQHKQPQQQHHPQRPPPPRASPIPGASSKDRSSKDRPKDKCKSKTQEVAAAAKEKLKEKTKEKSKDKEKKSKNASTSKRKDEAKGAKK